MARGPGADRPGIPEGILAPSESVNLAYLPFVTLPSIREMPGRTFLRIAVPLTLSLVLATEGLAQDAPRRIRKKPFEELSRSAQRLKDSLAVRLRPAPAPVTVFMTAAESAFIQLPAFAGLHDSVAATARSQIGTRYILGAERPGHAFDCSGLVRFVMSALLIDVPRTANEQARTGRQVDRDVAKLRPGDLLTFGRGSRVSHIGIYVGEGRFVHASTSKREVVESSIDRPNTWFRRNWVGVRRLLASADLVDTVALR